MAFQSKSPGLSMAPASLAAIIENHGSAHAQAAIAVHGGHVGTVHAIVLEMLVERLHAHGAHPLGNQIADGIIHHRRGDARLQAEAIRQVGSTVELTTADVDLAFGGLAKGNNSRVKPVNKSAQG